MLGIMVTLGIEIGRPGSQGQDLVWHFRAPVVQSVCPKHYSPGIQAARSLDCISSEPRVLVVWNAVFCSGLSISTEIVLPFSASPSKYVGEVGGDQTCFVFFMLPLCEYFLYGIQEHVCRQCP